MNEIIKKRNEIIIKIKHNLVAPETASLKSYINSLLKEQPVDITLDLSEVILVDSIGLATIVATYNSLHKLGCEFKIINIHKDIYNLFVTMSLHSHFMIECIKK